MFADGAKKDIRRQLDIIPALQSKNSRRSRWASFVLLVVSAGALGGGGPAIIQKKILDGPYGGEKKVPLRILRDPWSSFLSASFWPTFMPSRILDQPVYIQATGVLLFFDS